MTRIFSADERPEVQISDLDPGPVGYAASTMPREASVVVSKAPLWTRVPVWGWWTAGGSVAVAAMVTLIFVLFLNTHPVKVTVESFSWKRQIEVETYSQVHDASWDSVPGDAYNVESYWEVRTYRQVYSHTEYYDCGTTQYPRRCSRDVYRSEPVYDWRYYYTVDRWVTSGWLVTQKDDHVPVWAEIPATMDPSPVLGNDRVGNSRREDYWVHTDKYKLDVGLAKFLELEVGDTGTANVTNLDKVRSVNWDEKP